MSEAVESKRKQRPIAALALLFGLLLGISGGPAPQFDSNIARLAKGEILRTAGLRITGRSAEDSPDADAAPALLTPSPRVVTALAVVRPSATPIPAVASAASFDGNFPYQARAPPAA